MNIICMNLMYPWYNKEPLCLQGFSTILSSIIVALLHIYYQFGIVFRL